MKKVWIGFVLMFAVFYQSFRIFGMELPELPTVTPEIESETKAMVSTLLPHQSFPQKILEAEPWCIANLAASDLYAQNVVFRNIDEGFECRRKSAEEHKRMHALAEWRSDTNGWRFCLHTPEGNAAVLKYIDFLASEPGSGMDPEVLKEIDRVHIQTLCESKNEEISKVGNIVLIHLEENERRQKDSRVFEEARDLIGKIRNRPPLKVSSAEGQFFCKRLKILVSVTRLDIMENPLKDCDVDSSSNFFPGDRQLQSLIERYHEILPHCRCLYKELVAKLHVAAARPGVKPWHASLVRFIYDKSKKLPALLDDGLISATQEKEQVCQQDEWLLAQQEGQRRKARKSRRNRRPPARSRPCAASPSLDSSSIAGDGSNSRVVLVKILNHHVKILNARP